MLRYLIKYNSNSKNVTSQFMFFASLIYKLIEIPILTTKLFHMIQVLVHSRFFFLSSNTAHTTAYI